MPPVALHGNVRETTPPAPNSARPSDGQSIVAPLQASRRPRQLPLPHGRPRRRLDSGSRDRAGGMWQRRPFYDRRKGASRHDELDRLGDVEDGQQTGRRGVGPGFHSAVMDRSGCGPVPDVGPDGQRASRRRPAEPVSRMHDVPEGRFPDVDPVGLRLEREAPRQARRGRQRLRPLFRRPRSRTGVPRPRPTRSNVAIRAGTTRQARRGGIREPRPWGALTTLLPNRRGPSPIPPTCVGTPAAGREPGCRAAGRARRGQGFGGAWAGPMAISSPTTL